ncbi:tumor protein p53-inducible nuclear protein 2 isoform X3 [Hoplias malabaricus]|uniref:tumor protein p53-inducible nuclear protein 2 isoform X3 n=1 Tax=Hoplias malabaricus TaxID=27720 RepID=UPI003462F870
MFQRLSNLLFGEVEDVAAELNGPKPCVTEADEEGWLLVNLPEGAAAEASPMEDLLIEHPSMSVYVSPGNLPPVEQSTVSLTSSTSRMSDSAAPPVVRSLPTRVARGSACHAVTLAKITQVSRVQRAVSRVERRHLGRTRIQRQNRVRDQIPHRATSARKSFLHQPKQRSLYH